MVKNIVIYSDGTGQWGGLRPDQELSNVYKLYRATRNGPDSPIDPAQQVAFYDPGLGSGEADGWWEWSRKMWSSATGTGFTQNVATCYEAILRHYEPGDRIFLFGFSRGAYTVRSVAGVLNLCGVPTRMPDGEPIPRFGAACRAIAQEAVHDAYEHGAGKPRGAYEDEREEKARRFREKYGSTGEHPRRGNVAPYFIGVFDTVAALGLSGLTRAGYLTALFAFAAIALAGLTILLEWLGLGGGWAFTLALLVMAIPWLVYGYRHRIKTIRHFPGQGNFRWHWSSWKFEHYDRHLDPRVRYARHAISIDEDRATFARVGWASSADDPRRGPDDPPWLVQMWFPGNHSDIGGSYPEEESRLSDIALDWMVSEATGAEFPLIVDRSKLNLFPDPLGMQHSEIESFKDKYPDWWPERFRWSWKPATRGFQASYTHHQAVAIRKEAERVMRHGRGIKYDPLGEYQAGRKPPKR